jgi:hypothetical protein
MVHMARAYLTEKEMPRSLWFYPITHAARLMNTIPGKHSCCLLSPFLLVHGVSHNQRTWIPLFSQAYFHHEQDGDHQCSKHQAHTIDGIVIGCSMTSNAILVYNRRNKQYYEPDSYCLDSYYHLPSLTYQDIKYNGALFCYLLCEDNPQFEEKYPPGTRVECINPISNMLVLGTVMDIPFFVDVSNSTDNTHDLAYTILFDNGTTTSIPLSHMADLIPPPPITPSAIHISDAILPPFLQLNSRIIYKHKEQYHKGYLGWQDRIYRFSFKSHINKHKKEWGIPLPNLP